MLEVTGNKFTPLIDIVDNFDEEEKATESGMLEYDLNSGSSDNMVSDATRYRHDMKVVSSKTLAGTIKGDGSSKPANKKGKIQEPNPFPSEKLVSSPKKKTRNISKSSLVASEISPTVTSLSSLTTSDPKIAISQKNPSMPPPSPEKNLSSAAGSSPPSKLLPSPIKVSLKTIHKTYPKHRPNLSLLYLNLTVSLMRLYRLQKYLDRGVILDL